MKDHYDICVAGFWYGANYGSLLNGYSEYHILKNVLGKSVLMLQKPGGKNDDPEITQGHNSEFIKKYYNSDDISPSIPYNELNTLNNICDCFCAGSDQIWNYTLSFHENMYMPFAAADKKLISFATSFGHKKDKTPLSSRQNVRKHLQRFDAISVREDFDVDILRDNYGIKASLVFEPVFCIDNKYFYDLAEKSTFEENEPYLLAYILDPTPEKREAILYYGKKLGIKTIAILDGDIKKLQKNINTLNMTNTYFQISVENFLKAFKDASYVITDSFHGTAFSVIFNKPFLSIANSFRGKERFIDLTKRLELTNHLITDSKNIPLDEKYLKSPNYDKTNEIIKVEKEKTLSWIRNVIETPKAELPSPVFKKFPEYDLKNLPREIKLVRLLGSLLRDYGIKHIVLSAGTRHVDLARCFESNDCFEVHPVLDERSAGFYGIGLATALKKPVVICCTSGTAASNYLTSVSEAYYQHVPLIVITADRFPTLLNQREDQMVPQEGMFGSLALKSVSLPVVNDNTNFAVARRRICEAIIESTHNQPGPVHINIPISFNRPGGASDKHFPIEVYDISNEYNFRIRRYSLTPNRTLWIEPLNRLKSNLRVLILYGQAHPLSDTEKKELDTFSKHFNCAFAVDSLSNMKCAKSFSSFMTLSGGNIKRENYDELRPDIVITMNGNAVSAIKDFVYKFNNIVHWDIEPNGVIADPFKKLTRVFECDSFQFIRRMNYMAGDFVGDDSYYKSWKKFEIKHRQEPESYSMSYCIYNTIAKMPEKAILHLGNSSTVRMACACNISDKTEVFCNRGTNGIDGSASTFMGQAAVHKSTPAYLLIGDLSFFYDMNSVWNKDLRGNIRIMLFNNHVGKLLQYQGCLSTEHPHDADAKGWVESLGFVYISSRTKDEFDKNIDKFISDENKPMFFEVFC